MTHQQARALAFRAEVESLEDDRNENEYDAAAADSYAIAADIAHEEALNVRCPNWNSPYCMAHDYDHVLERREEQDDFNRAWAEHKSEFARREREQEAAAFMSDPDLFR